MTDKTMVEFFAGSGELAKAFAAAGYVTHTVDNNPATNPDQVLDVLTMKLQDLPEKFRHPDVVHFGVPCTKFSIAGLKSNFINFMPTDIDSCIALALVYKCLDLIDIMQPKSWFIENPMGYLRKFPFMQKLPLKHLWYCQYGHSAAKPTDFWTNRVEWIPKKCFNNNKKCHHEASPRGCNTGTQGMKDAYTRGIYPALLCKEIVSVCEGTLKGEKQKTL